MSLLRLATYNPTGQMSETTSAEHGIDLKAGLRRLGFESFRPGQEQALQTLFAERRLLLVAPTGGGKSLIYQLPAAMLPGTTLVVSPLVALMQDQVAALEDKGIAATFLAATLEGHEIRRRMQAIGNGAYQIVYVAPERLALAGFRGLLARLDIALVAVDEAHCISEWGHDFRPEYLQIGELLRTLDPPRVMACTATATPIVRDEILARLGLPPDTSQIVTGFARPNLALRVAEIGGPKERHAQVDAFLREAVGAPGNTRGTAIIYAPTRKSAEEESERLGRLRWRVAHYHAGLDGTRRDKVLRAFMQDELEIVVATNASGMGIDRADVVAVVHLAPPGSIEAYYQEVGRAGRDGRPAYALMFISGKDIVLRRRLIERDAGGGLIEPSVVEHKWNLFLELMRWSEGGSCRHDAILRYFGDEAETLHGCGHCDVCESFTSTPEQDFDTVQLVVRKALSGVARVHGRFGLHAAVKLLRGSTDERLQRAGLDRSRTFGVLSECSEAWLLKMLRRCVTAGWVDFHGEERPVVYLTEDGKQVMKGIRPARLLLPRERDQPRVRAPAAEAGSRTQADVAELDERGLALFEALRRHRLIRARADGVPPYVVASDRTLREIALLRPRTMQELALAHGIGPSKLDRYGKELLEVVAQMSAV